MPKTHRVRRGKVVEIPEEWRGKVTSNQTKNKRRKLAESRRRARRQYLRRQAAEHFASFGAEEHGPATKSRGNLIWDYNKGTLNGREK